MTKTNKLLIIYVLILLTSCNERKVTNEDNSSIKIQIDSYIKNAITAFEIPGISVAVLKENKILYKNSFGYTSIQDSTLVNDNTMFRIFSTTKLFTAVGIFQLIEDNEISLEDPIEKYISPLPDKWKGIRINNLLTHSSGLPNMIWFKNDLSDSELMKQLAAADMDFEIGQEFRYNQTNYWFLARIIEKVTNMPYEQFIINNQFDSDPKGVLFLSNSDSTIANRANKYNYNYEEKKFDKDLANDGPRALAGNGLNININQFIEWDKKLENNKILKASTQTKMWSPFEYTNGKRDFLMGWGKYYTNNTYSYGFSGGNLSNFRKFIDDEVTIILLSNGYKLNAYDIIVDDIARMCIDSIKKDNPILESDVFNLVKQKEYNKAKSLYKKLVVENPNTSLGNLKWNINKMGNWHLEASEYKEAINVYNTNAASIPEWWVSYVGLAECYENIGDKNKSINLYQKAMTLNIENEMNYNPVLKEIIEKLKNTDHDKD